MRDDGSERIILFHGIPGVIPTFDALTRQLLPGVTALHVLHQELFWELCANGGLTESILSRFCAVMRFAEQHGAALVLVTGSTFSPAVDEARKSAAIPILKVDEVMAEEAVQKGERLGLLATEEATLRPSEQILLETAANAGKRVSVAATICPGARALYDDGDTQAHDAIIADQIDKLNGKVDAIILAQASMYGAYQIKKGNTQTPLFASPELAVLGTARALGLQK